MTVDSVVSTDCFTLQMSASHICCEPDTGNFCELQCNNGLCVCVDPITGNPTIDFRFPESDEGFDCSQSESLTQAVILL